jgi:hypothetical protein
MFRDRIKEAGGEVFRLKESSGLVEWVRYTREQMNDPHRTSSSRARTMSGDDQTREIFSLFFFLGGGLGLVSWCSVSQSLGHVQNAHSVELFSLSILYACSPSVLVLCRICSAQKHTQSSNGC